MTIENVLDAIRSSLTKLIPFLALAATVILVFGIVKYITAGGDEESTKNARRMIIFGIIGLALMLSLWAFVRILIAFFGLDGAPTPIPGGSIVPTF